MPLVSAAAAAAGGTPARIRSRAGVRCGGGPGQRLVRVVETGCTAIRDAGCDGVVAAMAGEAADVEATQHPDTITSSTTAVQQAGAAGATYDTTVPQHGSQHRVAHGSQQAARRCRWQQAASASNAESVVTAQMPNATIEPRVLANISRSPLESSL